MNTRIALLLFLFVIQLLGFSCRSEAPDSPDVVENKTSPLGYKDYDGGEQPFSPQDPFVKKYTGNIGADKPIDLQLVNWGDGFLSGFFAYQQNARPIELQGEMSLNEMVTLQAYQGDQAIDKFVFPFTDLQSINGKWTGPNGKENLDFSLHAVVPTNGEKWSGSWYLNGIWDDGVLLIGDVRDTAFYFALSFTTNGHIGEVEGEAKIAGDSAVFSQRLEGEEEACQLHFFLHKNYIKLDQRSATFACGFGMRAHASGRYDNKITRTDPVLTFGGDDGVFVSAEQHDQFKTWIGDQNYLQIAYNMQVQEAKDYQNDKEKIKGRQTTGVVMGLMTSNEAIILHDGNTAFWAATIAPAVSDKDELVVRYFTNQVKWKNKLPKAFEDWRESFPDYEVVY